MLIGVEVLKPRSFGVYGFGFGLLIIYFEWRIGEHLGWIYYCFVFKLSYSNKFCNFDSLHFVV